MLHHREDSRIWDFFTRSFICTSIYFWLRGQEDRTEELEGGWRSADERA